MGRNALRLALIGAGRWGKCYIATLTEMTDVELVTLVSRRAESRNLVGPNCSIASDWRDVMKDPGIDGIIIATPPATHFEIARAAIIAGKPVLVEKPLTLDADEAQALLVLAKETNVPVLVDHTHLYSPAYQGLKAALDRIGSIQEIHSSGGNRGPVRSDTPVLWDWAPHDLAMCLDVVGEDPVDVQAECMERKRLDGNMGERVRIMLGFPSGVRAYVEVSNISPIKVRRFEAIGVQGRLVYDDQAEDKLCIMDGTGNSSPLSISSDMPLSRAVDAFAELIKDCVARPQSLKLGVKITRLLISCESQIRA